MKHAIYTVLFAALPFSLWAQFTADSLRSDSIREILITAARLPAPALQLPYAVSSLDANQIQRGQQLRSLHESLQMLPGVLALNSDNYAQDLRLSIRGFGARAAFGIRGIRVYTDGLPDASPDGQADVDHIDPGSLSRIEVLRGASAGLYGNASGGVLQLSTEEVTEKFTGSVQATAGSFGLQRYQLKTGIHQGKISALFNASHQQWTGYREHAAMQQTNLYFKLRYAIRPATKITLLYSAGISPNAEDAGGLTADQVQENRRQARTASVQYDAGEAVRQHKTGFTGAHIFSEKSRIDFAGFVTFRDFSNKLAFKNGGIVGFKRIYGGGNLRYTYQLKKYRTQAGIEWNRQRDNRKRYDNLDGTQGDLTLAQAEIFQGTGVFWLHEYRPLKSLRLSLTTRYDRVKLQAKDQFLSDGDQSGGQDFDRGNIAAGFNWKIDPKLYLYANTASNFETPALNELSANPDNTGGFNPVLKPQQSWNYEVGVKAPIHRNVQLELAAFLIPLRDELVPYQIASAPGRTFYRNAGRSLRRGIEASGTAALSKQFQLMANYTFSDFRYKDYTANETTLDGNRQPVIPRHYLFTALQWTATNRWFAAVQVRHQSSVFTDDANTNTAGAYTLVSLRSSYELPVKRAKVSVFAGISNLFGASYTDNILLNAVGGRYYEPGPDMAAFYGGVKLGW